MKSALETNSSSDNEVHSIVSMAAHDLRSPLMSIKGLIYLMQLESEKENLTDYFAILDKSVERMNLAISDIILRSQQEENENDSEVVDVKLIIEECIHDLQYMVGAKFIHHNPASQAHGNFLYCWSSL